MWKLGRVVYAGNLENYQVERPQRFESFSFLQFYALVAYGKRTVL